MKSETGRGMLHCLALSVQGLKGPEPEGGGLQGGQPHHKGLRPGDDAMAASTLLGY